MAQSQGINISEMPVPTDADIARAQQQRIARMIRTALADEDRPRRSRWTEELTESLEASPAQLAEAVLHLLAGRELEGLGEPPSEEPPPWAKPRGIHPRVNTNTNEVELFFPVGRNRNIRPADIVGALANELRIPTDAIGRITLLDRKSFVGLPRELAEQVANEVDSIELRGNQVPVQLARPRPDPGQRDGERPRPRFKRFKGQENKPWRPNHRKGGGSRGSNDRRKGGGKKSGPGRGKKGPKRG